MPKAKLLLDENIGKFVIRKLREDGYNIVSILETKTGANDETVLSLALGSQRIIITLDKDFGRLVHLYSRKHAGVILLRLADESPENIYKTLILVLKQPLKRLKKKFLVATETKIRLR